MPHFVYTVFTLLPQAQSDGNEAAAPAEISAGAVSHGRSMRSDAVGRLMSWLSRFSANLRRHLQRPEGVPWLAMYTLEKHVPPFRLEEYPGLLHAHQVREAASSDRLVCYWASRETFDAYHHLFEGALHLTAAPTCGAVIMPVWRRTWLPRSAAGWIVGGIGATATVYSGFILLRSALFAIPTVSIEPGVALVNALVGEATVAAFEVVNQHPDASCDVRLVTVSDSASTARIRPSSRMPLASGEIATISVVAKFQHDGLHKLTLRGSARGGWLRSATTAEGTVPVRVWHEKSETAIAARRSSSPKTCALEAVLQVGIAHPSGLKCDAGVQQPFDLRFRGVTSPNSRGWSDPIENLSTVGAETMQVTWHVDPLPAFTEVPTRIYVEARPPRTIDLSECEQLASRMTWGCARP
jgi:hypothetical protein